jgi:hypothetical protein
LSQAGRADENAQRRNRYRPLITADPLARA